jgi:hypothetical protein
VPLTVEDRVPDSSELNTDLKRDELGDIAATMEVTTWPVSNDEPNIKIIIRHDDNY